MGKVYSLATSGFLSKIYWSNVPGTILHNASDCTNTTYAYTIFYSFVLQAIYMIHGLLDPENKDTTSFKMSGTTCLVKQRHIPDKLGL
jgi:hypothetical protein